MKKTDMELQAIREKLKQLENEPVTGDVLSMPWSSPQQASLSQAAYTPRYQPAERATSGQFSSDNRQAAAIEALKQRSGSQINSPRNDELVAQEIYRLEVHARNINERSQQQAAEILAMKRSAQQAAVALKRQGIHNHPQLNAITQFLEAYPSASVPQLGRDSQGRFTLSHSTVNLHHAEQEAASTAQTLRERRPGHITNAQSHAQSSARNIDTQQTPALFSQPIETNEGSRRRRSHKPWASITRAAMTRLRRRSRSHATSASSQITPDLSAAESPSNRFSWMDGAIWFSAAAIARIILEAVVVSYPLLRIPLLIILFSIIVFSIYRVFISKSNNLSSAYRLGIALLGLFLGSSF